VLMAKNYVDNLSEEVKKGLLEKAEQGHWPTRAPVGYVDNLATHRIEIDTTRAPLIAKLFVVCDGRVLIESAHGEGARGRLDPSAIRPAHDEG
jgi:DNA invertase Pin-like site-specific DNA recombinase